MHRLGMFSYVLLHRISRGPVELSSGAQTNIPSIRRQLPLAPGGVLMHFGLQGITAKNGLVAFLSKPSWMKDADYILAIYVVLSRLTKLEDLWIMDLPAQHFFEEPLHTHNPVTFGLSYVLALMHRCDPGRTD